MMNKQTFTGRWLMAGLVAAITVTAAQAQISKLDDAEKNMRGTAPPGANSGNGAPASTDPKDFSGSWRSAGGPGGGGMGAGGAPGGDGMGAGGAPGGAPGAGGPGGPGGGAPGGAPGGGAPGGGPGSDINPAGNNASAGQLPARILCLPQEPLYTGVDGPTTIIQTPEEINWASEEMFHHRRIYLTGSLPINPKPSYLGVSVGHWEGNALVVETVGLKSMAAGAKMVERWTKSEDSKTLTIAVTNIDATGKSSAGRNTSLSWANGQETLEWICEDFNEEWLPGGTDYEDQVGKSAG